MDLLNPYLQAVKFWLPKGQQDDIAQELSDDIRSQVADKEAELGRELHEAEMEAILKRFGNPLIVASHYLPQEQLIGPVVFPIYRFVLKMVGLCYLLPWLLVWIGLLTFSPSYRAEHPGWSAFEPLGTWWTLSFYLIGMITLGFAVMERVQAKTKFFDNWSPRKLPPVRDVNRIPRSTSVSEIVSSIVAILYWVIATKPTVIHDKTGAVIIWHPGSVWQTFHGAFYWPVLLFTIAGVGQAAYNLFHPHWTRLRLGVRVLVHFAGLVMLAFILAPHWAEVRSLAARLLALKNAAPVGEIAEGWTNIGVFTGALIAAIIIGIMCLWDARRVIWWRDDGPSVATGAGQEVAG
jgi:hypothetical protein